MPWNGLARSAPEGDDDGERDRRGVVAGELVVAVGDAAEVLQMAKHGRALIQAHGRNHILTSGTPFKACSNKKPMSRTTPAETAATALSFTRSGKSTGWSISQPAIGKICSAWIPTKCATLRSPPLVLQLSSGRPGPPGATPTPLCPCTTISPPMADPAKKTRIPNTIPDWVERETLYFDCKAKISSTRTMTVLKGSTMSITRETAESNGVLLLKCEV